MTIRTLPAAPRSSRHPNVSCEISPRALERWNPDLKSVSAADGKTDNAVISILDVIGHDFWTGEGVTAKRVSGALRAIGEKPVTVEINSPGGDFFEGLAIYNVLREHPKPVSVKILGLAASAASVVAMAGDDIRIARAGFLMIHNVWVVAVGNRNDLRDVADWLEPFDGVAADLYSARTGMSVKDVAKLLDKEAWLGGSEAVEQGFADALLAADEVDAKAKNETMTGAVLARRRLEIALAKGEKLPRSLRRQLLKEISGTHDAADDKGDTPSAVQTVKPGADGMAGLNMGLARLKLLGA